MTYKKTLIVLSLTMMVILCGAFIPQEQELKKQESEFKNLKVLPKNITHDELEKVMDGFKLALGVKCNFCHAPKKDDPRKMDFPSDDNQHKNIARKMIKMTAKINKKFFKRVDNDGAITNISCISCHNGKEHPNTIKVSK